MMTPPELAPSTPLPPVAAALCRAGAPWPSRVVEKDGWWVYWFGGKPDVNGTHPRRVILHEPAAGEAPDPEGDASLNMGTHWDPGTFRPIRSAEFGRWAQRIHAFLL